MSTATERRRFRRAELDVPVAIRSLDREGADTVAITGQVKNVSLAGVYCYVGTPCPLQVGEQVVCTISVPSEQARLFPFTRLLGKGWVARLEPIVKGRRAGESPTEEQLLGMAVAFTPDVTALGTIENY